MNNKERFEELLSKASERPGFDGLMNYIHKSDFYTAPASTKFHLSCEGGLLQHSLNVYDALIGKLLPGEMIPSDTKYTEKMWRHLKERRWPSWRYFTICAKRISMKQK